MIQKCLFLLTIAAAGLIGCETRAPDKNREEAALREEIVSLVTLGPGALPRIAAYLSHRSPVAREAAADAAAHLGLEAQSLLASLTKLGSSDSDESVRLAAKEAVVLVDPVTRSSADRLIGLANGGDVASQRGAARALAEHGRQAIAPLVALARHSDDRVRQMAFGSLASLDSSDDSVIEALRTGLQDRVPATRYVSAIGLIVLRPRDRAATRMLVKLAAGEDKDLALTAIHALGASDVDAALAAETLHALAQSPNPEIAAAARAARH